MSGIEIHDWFIVYVCAALLFAGASTVFADQYWTADPPQGSQRLALIVLAGALWPILAVGLAQLLVIEVVARHIRHRHAVYAPLTIGRH